MPALVCNTKVGIVFISPSLLIFTGLKCLLAALPIDRYCQGMRAESEEDFSVWRACAVSQQHGTQSNDG